MCVCVSCVCIFVCTWQVWDIRALEVEAECAKFVTTHKLAVGTTEGLYLHILHAHAGQQVRRWGDLRVRQSQGLEHSHAKRKKIGLNGTNRKVGQRLETMLCFKHVLASVTRMDCTDFHAHTHEKNKLSTIRRAVAKVERVSALTPSPDSLRTIE